MKKSSITIFIVLLMSTASFAQSTLIYSNPEFEVYRIKPGNGIQKMTVKSSKKKSGYEEVFYTPQGRVDQWFTYGKNDKCVKRTTFTYNDSGYQTSRTEYKKGKFLRRQFYDYTDYAYSGQTNYYKDSVTAKSQTRITYNERKKISTSCTTNRKGKENSRTEYTYYENGSRKEVVTYKNGKLKNKWTYDCDPTGAVEKKETQICANRIYESDSSFTETDIYFKKGKETKRVTRADKNGLVKELASYNKKGEVTSSIIYVYNSEKKLVKMTYKWGKELKKGYVNEYAYNDKNRLVQHNKINAKGKSTYKAEYAYN